MEVNCYGFVRVIVALSVLEYFADATANWLMTCIEQVRICYKRGVCRILDQCRIVNTMFVGEKRIRPGHYKAK